MHHIQRVALLAFVAVLLAVSLAYYAPMLRHAVPPAAGPCLGERDFTAGGGGLTYAKLRVAGETSRWPPSTVTERTANVCAPGAMLA